MPKTAPSSSRRWPVVALSILGLLILAYGWLLAYHVQAVSYFEETPADWQSVTRSECIKWHHRMVYGDLRPESKNHYAPLELSCWQARRLPRQELFTQNSRGQKLRYLRFNHQHKDPQSPIMLYVHGIASSHITGLKFYPVAKRMGFELVMLELSNHGYSDDDGSGAGFGCREADDVISLLKTLKQTDPNRPILLYGSSMGAMTIANASPQLAEFQNQLKAVVLENPQSNLRDILGVYADKLHAPSIHTDLVVWLTGLRAGEDYTSCAPTVRLKQLTYPAWVTISEKDFLVPVWMARKVFEHLPSGYPHVYGQYPYGDHSGIWNGQPKRYEADLKHFWQQSLKFASKRTKTQLAER